MEIKPADFHKNCDWFTITLVKKNNRRFGWFTTTALDSDNNDINRKELYSFMFSVDNNENCYLKINNTVYKIYWLLIMDLLLIFILQMDVKQTIILMLKTKLIIT